MITPNSPQPSLHLEEVWKQRSESDQLGSIAMLLHHAKLGFVYLSKSPLTSILSVLSVATVLFILGLVIALQNTSLLGLNSAAGQLRMSIFVQDSFSESDWQSLEAKAAGLLGLSQKQRLDKISALNNLKSMFPENPDLLSGLEEDNPLPASLELSFDVNLVTELATYAKEFRAIKGVDSVAYDGQLVKVLSEIGSKLKGTGKVSYLILIGLTLFLISTTIRISLYHEKEEIEIMSLVGAYPAFIQAPFLIAGALQGLFGALIACLLLKGFQGKLLGTFQADSFLSQASINFSLLNFSSLLMLGFLGIAAGVFGSYLASRHFR